MGFYLRKSIKVGAFRFNLSKSGIGISAGVKGFRIGTGPRGNYVHMGRGGIYYRASLSGKKSGQSSNANLKPFPVPKNIEQNENLTEIESGSILEMVDSSSLALLEEIRKKHKQLKYGPILLFATIIGFFVFLPFSIIVIILGGISTFLAYKWDEMRKSVVLLYEFDEDNEKLYQRFFDAFNKMNTARVWHIQAAGATNDWKRNAGANSLVNRKSIFLKKTAPPYIKTNIEIPSIPVGRQVLYFFPDRLLVFDKNEVGAVGYKEINIDIDQINFIETEPVPYDSEVVSHTWKYVNKNGGPDRRFNDNRQLPVVRYEQVHFTSKSGLNEMIQLSKVGVSNEFKSILRELAECIK
jgi:hypothetical protein